MQMDLRKVASVLVCSPRSRGERDSEIPGTLKRGEEHDVPISNHGRAGVHSHQLFHSVQNCRNDTGERLTAVEV